MALHLRLCVSYFLCYSGFLFFTGQLPLFTPFLEVFIPFTSFFFIPALHPAFMVRGGKVAHEFDASNASLPRRFFYGAVGCACTVPVKSGENPHSFFGLKMRSGANMAALSCAECLQLIEHNRYVLRKRSSELGITVDDTGFPKIRRGSPLIMYPALVSTCLFPITEHEELHFTDASLRRPLFLTEVNAAGLLIARRRRRLIKLK